MLSKGKLAAFFLVALLGLSVVEAQRGRKRARDQANERDGRRKAKEREAINRVQTDGGGTASGSERNNKCRDRQLCESITSDSRVNIDEGVLLGEEDPSQVQNINSGSIIATSCFLKVPNCDSNEPYRRANGTCNNLQQPVWGSTFTPFTRTLDPRYEPNNEVQTGINPRLISRVYHTNSPVQETRLTLMFMQWGQFLDHDITATPVTTFFDENEKPIPIDCCDPAVDSLIDDCAAIPIINDPVFTFGCMNFMRSAPSSQVLNGQCTLGPREQFNQITSFIDASNVYGSDDKTQNDLRGSDGLMGTTTINSQSFLPYDTESCGVNNCFKAGDDRSNEQPGLTSLHTIFVREHNHIATKIRQLNPTWSSDKIFFETRKIVAAEMQVITYNEFLPAALGNDQGVSFNQHWSLDIPTVYDPSMDPSIYNEFATAAFRFGHSDIPTNLPFSTPARLSLHFFNTEILHSAGNPINQMASGFLDQCSMATDKFFTEEITDNLFRSGNIAFDLVSLNIQRGRDHGLPSYKAYKEFFGGTVSGDIEPTLFNELLTVYEGNPDAIDLFVGAISENKAPGAAVGPLFQVILRRQFERLRNGDRFFFDNGLHYTPVAVTELKKVRLAAILCRNADLTGPQGEFAFLKNNANTIDCSSAAVQQGVDVGIPGFFSSPPATTTTPSGGRRRGGRRRGGRRRG